MTGHLHTMAFLDMSGSDMIIIMVIGLLVFGRRLPEVARNLGKSLNEFKKGMRDFQDSADQAVSHVEKATNEAMSEADVQTAASTTYEDSSGSYENPADTESVSQAEGDTTSDNPETSPAADIHPTEPSASPSTPADATVTGSGQGPAQPANAEPTALPQTDTTGTYQPTA